jgi:DNA sulfur modification protein DndD
LKIKSLTLHNFRQFKDLTLDFSTDNNKNVTVILAENSIGKTTLTQSIKWCLYGEEETDLENKSNMLNQSVKDTSMREKELYWVEVDIVEENTVYNIRREKEVFTRNNRAASEDKVTMEYQNNLGETIILNSLNSTENLKKINRMINKILTREMSQYFIFDGERINNLGSNNNKSKKDIQKAISAINGLPILENSIRSLQKVEKILRNEVIKSINDKDLTLLDRKRNNLENECKDFAERINGITIEIETKEQRVNELDSELGQFDQIKSKIEERKKLEIKMKKSSNAIESKQKNVLNSMGNYLMKSMALLVQEKFKDLTFNEEYEAKSIPNMQADAIDKIIERGVCICGEKITESHLQHLLEQKNYQPPISNAVLIESFKSETKSFISGMNENYIQIKLNTNQYYEYIEEVDDDASKMKELDLAIGSSDSESVQQKNDERISLKKEISKSHKILGAYEQQLLTAEESLKDAKSLYDKLVKEKAANDYNSIKVELVEDSILFLEDKNKKERLERKQSIEEKANGHLSQIIYKNKHIELSDNYEYSVKEFNGVVASPSEGERVSISISLILAIIDAHKEKVNVNRQKSENLDLEYEKDFVIIMDAAFATLDNQFSERISNKLPHSVEQVVLFSTKRQYEGAVQKSLEKYLGRMYELRIPVGERENQVLSEDLERYI